MTAVSAPVTAPRFPAAGVLRVVRAELTRLAGRRFPLAIAVVGLGMVALSISGIASSATDPTAQPVDAAALTARTFRLCFAMGLFAMIAGALMPTTAFGSRLLGYAAAVVPDRRSIVAATALIAIALGALYGLAGAGVAYLTTSLVLPSYDVAPQWTGETATTAAWVVVIAAASGPLGAGAGYLLRSSVTSALLLTLWTVAAEPIVLDIVPAVGRWLPGGAVTAMLDEASLPERLGRPAGLAVLSVWIAVALAAAVVRLRRQPL